MTSVVVVGVLFRAADSVLRWAGALELAREAARDDASVTVIAIDNASGDGTAERLSAAAPWVTLVRADRNRGFAAGCNLGLALAPDDAIVVLLNPDVVVAEDFFLRIAEIEWTETLAAVGPRVLTPAGGIEQSARAFPSVATGVFGRTTLLSKLLPEARMVRRHLLADATADRVVDWVSGACLVAPAKRFRAVGGLDEGYWMYWEDADWCRRARDLGLLVEYRPEIIVTHHQGASSRERPWCTQIAFHRSAARYYRRHVARSGLQARAAECALLVRATLKLVPAAFRRLALGDDRGDGD